AIQTATSHLPRRLPGGPLPARDESCQSWIDRIAVELTCPSGLVAQRIGLPHRRSKTGVRVSLFGIWLTDSASRAMSQATAIDVAVLHQMHLCRYDGTAISFSGLAPDDEKTLIGVSNREWFTHRSSRACPECLRESPQVWLVWWRLSWAACCPKHRCRLL